MIASGVVKNDELYLVENGSEIIYKDSLNAFLKENKFGLKEIDDGFFYKCISGHHPEEFLLDLEKQGFVKNSESINPNNVREYYNNFFANLNKRELTTLATMVYGDTFTERYF